MLDDLLDVFGRKKRKPGSSGGFQGMLSSIVGDDDDRHSRNGRYPAPRHGFGDSDDSDDRGRHHGDGGYGRSRRDSFFED